jgi:hypothetical protein
MELVSLQSRCWCPVVVDSCRVVSFSLQFSPVLSHGSRHRLHLETPVFVRVLVYVCVFVRICVVHCSCLFLYVSSLATRNFHPRPSSCILLSIATVC